MKTRRFCNRCNTEVERETKLDYPYYCPQCDENLYSFETQDEQSDTSQGVVRLCAHNIEWWLDGGGHSLSQTDEEHICSMLSQNFFAGELCSTTADGGEVYGWWKIQRIDIEL